MKAEKAVYALLAADGGVTTLVSTRIYPHHLPQGATLEAIAYQLVGTPRELHHEGAETSVESRVQVTCHTETYAEAKVLQDAVRAAANGYTGTPASVTVEKCYTDDGPDDYDSDSGTYQAVIDLLITYQE